MTTIPIVRQPFIDPRASAPNKRNVALKVNPRRMALDHE
jgi:hypothetical protein